MNQIWLLTKVQLRTAFDFHIMSKKTNQVKKKNAAFITAIVIFFLLISVVTGFYSYFIGISLKQIGLLDLLPELMMAVTCVITLITTIYKVKGTLFGFKDYDMIMSLPVKTSDIVVSRLLLLYLINIFFTMIIMIPASIVYGILAQVSPLFYGVSLIMVFFIPFIPIIAATIIGTLITVVASRFRHSNIITIIITFALLTGAMVVSFTLDDSTEMLGDISVAITKQVDSIYPLAEIYKRAVCDLNIISMVLFLSFSILSFLLFSWVVGLKFKVINTNLASKSTKANYQLGNLEQASPFKALYRKELRRYFSSSLYVMNTAVGLVMMSIGAIATLFMSSQALEQVTQVPELSKFIGTLAPFAVSMCVVLTYITACSISLEGKNLWILKSSPVLVKTIFLSKIAVNLTITLPAVILDSILIAIGLKLTLPEFIILLVMPAAYSFFAAVFGLIVNLSLPNLNWTTEVTVIKQSAASMVAAFGGIIVVAIPVVLIFTFSGINALYLNGLVTIIMILASIGMYHFLNTRGKNIFMSL